MITKGQTSTLTRLTFIFLLAGVMTLSSASTAAEERPDPNKITSSKIVSCAKWGAFFVAGCSGVAGLVFDELVDKYVGIQPLRLAAGVSTLIWGGATYLEYRAQCNKDKLCTQHARDIKAEKEHLAEQLAEAEENLAETIQSLDLLTQQLVAKEEERQQTRAELEQTQRALSAKVEELRRKTRDLEDLREQFEEKVRIIANLEVQRDREIGKLNSRISLLLNEIIAYKDKNEKANREHKFYKAAINQALLDAALKNLDEVLNDLILRDPHNSDTYRRLLGYRGRLCPIDLSDQPLDATIIPLLCRRPEQTDLGLRLVFNEVIDASKRSMSQSNRLQLLIDELNKINPRAMGTLWGSGYASNIQFALTPEYANTERTQLKQDHSASMWKKWKQAIVSAERYVDITSLSAPDAGDKGFSDILKEAIVELAAKGKPITVRILFATIPALVGLNPGSQKIESARILTELIELPGVKDSQLEISVGAYDVSITRTFSLSWNHSKIVAADDNVLFTGGHNLYNSYLWMDPQVRPNIPKQPAGAGPYYSAPVHDVSALLEGPGVAVTAHKFADRLWEFISKSNEQWKQKLVWSAKADVWKPRWGKLRRCTSNDADCYLKPFEAGAIEPEKNNAHRFISVGRFGNLGSDGVLDLGWDDKQKQISDEAILQIIRGTKSAVFLSQQRIMPLQIQAFLGHYQVTHRFNELVLEELAGLINANRHVFILTSSNLKEASGTGLFGYESGTAPAELERKLIGRVQQRLPNRDLVVAVSKVKNYLHYVPTANGSTEVPNHAKVVISDGDIAYIGSSNVYDDSHQEFGVVIGREKTIELLKTYYRPLWEISQQYWDREGREKNEKRK